MAHKIKQMPYTHFNAINFILTNDKLLIIF